MWSILEDWPLESAQLVLYGKLKCGDEDGGCRFSLECDGCVRSRVALLSEHSVN